MVNKIYYPLETDYEKGIALENTEFREFMEEFFKNSRRIPHWVKDVKFHQAGRAVGIELLTYDADKALQMGNLMRDMEGIEKRMEEIFGSSKKLMDRQIVIR